MRPVAEVVNHRPNPLTTILSREVADKSKFLREVGVDTGDPVHLEMRRLGDAKPQELEDLLASDVKARKAWETGAIILFVADAKKPETRMKRARRVLGR